MRLSPVPLVVVSGYLGAGKTSILLHLLRHAGGRRILCLVNDFGALQIDRDLIAEADGEAVALSNGCVCCAMTGDLFFAVGDALDRRPRPDAVVIEASGVSDPARIAAVARAEPDLLYGGIVTAVDALGLAERLADPQVGGHVRDQIVAADLIAATRAGAGGLEAVRALVAPLSAAPVVAAPHGAMAPDLVLDRAGAALGPGPSGSVDHGDLYESWSHAGGDRVAQGDLEAFLRGLPSGVLRVKGVVALADGGAVEVHKVGPAVDIRSAPARDDSRIVAIGPTGRFDPASIEAAWARLVRAV